MNVKASHLPVYLLILSAALTLCNGRPSVNGKFIKQASMTIGLERTPVVIIPGKGGNQIEARRSSPSNASCPLQRQHGWYRIWMDVWQMFPGEIECWADTMQLVYDEDVGDSHNAPGIEIRVPGWGDVHTIEYIDPSITAWVLGNAGTYMATFIHELERWGYKRGKDLRGAPYDFRYSPGSQEVFFRELQHLIEDTYYINGRKKVAIISHSLGGLFGTYFLNIQTQEWKDQFISFFTTVNTPWEGTAYMPMMMVSGSNLGVEQINPLAIRQQQRSYETAPLLLPTIQTWTDKRFLILTPEKNYTANDYFELFDRIGYNHGKRLYEKATWDRDMIEHPGVDMYCLYSTGVDTMESARYSGPLDEKPVEITMGDGDGTVNRRSLTGCARFYDSNFPFHMRHYRNMDHNGVLNHKRFYKHMRNLLIHL